MQGLHLTADLRDCPAGPALTEPETLRRLCRAAVDASGLQPVGELFHAFGAPGGVTGVLLLAESHVAVHTWPELGRVTLDVFVCNLHSDNSQRAQRLLAELEASFGAAGVEHHRIERGRS